MGGEPALEDDRDALAGFRAGRADVLERLYHAHVDGVFCLVAGGFATRGGVIRPERDPAEQRSIIQDVFVRAFADRARAGYDGLRPYRPYLMTIARNVMIDRVRARSTELARVADVDVDALAEADVVPGEVEDDAEMAGLRASATAYLATLDREQRAFVEARFERDLSQADAAAALGVTRRRVRTLEARVIRGFKKFVKKNRPGSPPAP